MTDHNYLLALLQRCESFLSWEGWDKKGKEKTSWAALHREIWEVMQAEGVPYLTCLDSNTEKTIVRRGGP